jgi:hypothetical protein
MNIREFNDHIFLSKKAHFLACVKLAAETIGAPIPNVNFEGCTSFDKDLAHIHIEQNKICISEQYLKWATDEDLRDTATHEVTHLIDETHNISFVKAHTDVKTASWIREHTSNVIDDKKRLNSDCVTPAPKVEKIETLESLRSQYRILISEIDDCVDKGNLIKRKELVEKVSNVIREIRAIETPISETNVEQQSHKPDWVEIENAKHNLDLTNISLEEKTTKELTEDIKHSELELSPKKQLKKKYIPKKHENIQKEREEQERPGLGDENHFHSIDKAQKREEDENTKELTEASTLQTSEDKDSKRKSILQEIEEMKNLINITKAISGAPSSEGGISREKANKTIQLFNKGISNLEKELRELESEPKNIAINITSQAIRIEPKDKDFAKTLQELHTEAKAEESIKCGRSGYKLFAIIIGIILIISFVIFVVTLDTSNRTIPVSTPVTIPVNNLQQNSGSPIVGTWKFENTQGIVSTIIFDKNDNAILDGKPFKYSIVGSNLILKDNKSSSAIPYKLVDGNNLLLKLRGTNYDNYVKI